MLNPPSPEKGFGGQRVEKFLIVNPVSSLSVQNHFALTIDIVSLRTRLWGSGVKPGTIYGKEFGSSYLNPRFNIHQLYVAFCYLSPVFQKNAISAPRDPSPWQNPANPAPNRIPFRSSPKRRCLSPSHPACPPTGWPAPTLRRIQCCAKYSGVSPCSV